MIEQIWLGICNKPKPFYGFDFASLEAFVLVQYPSDHTIVQVIEHWLQAPTTYLSIILNPTANFGIQQIC